MNITPEQAWQFRSSHGVESAGDFGDWYSCSAERAAALKYRDGFEVRALFVRTESDSERRLAGLLNSLCRVRADERVRLRLALGLIRDGEHEHAACVLRSITST